MSSGVPEHASKRIVVVTTAELNDADGVKASVATSTSAAEYSGHGLNGAAVLVRDMLPTGGPVSVTTSASVGSYTTTDPIVVTGRRGGLVVTDELLLTATGGGETIEGTVDMDEIVSIAIPAQTDTNGAFQFGTVRNGDVDAIKTSIATSASPATYSDAALNGAGIVAVAALRPVPRAVTVTTSAFAATYNTTDPIVITGKRCGETQTEELFLTAAGGNETIRGSKAFDTIDSIAIPAQDTTSGAFTFGVGDLCGHSEDVLCRSIKALADGYVHCRWGESAINDSALPVTAAQIEPVAPTRVLASQALTNPTGVDLVLYL